MKPSSKSVGREKTENLTCNQGTPCKDKPSMLLHQNAAQYNCNNFFLSQLQAAQESTPKHERQSNRKEAWTKKLCKLIKGFSLSISKQLRPMKPDPATHGHTYIETCILRPTYKCTYDRCVIFPHIQRLEIQKPKNFKTKSEDEDFHLEVPKLT